MRQLFVSAVISIGLATSAAASSLTDTFSSFLILGDSLSDDGNLFEAIGVPGAPYVDGRFSDGSVWNEDIAAEFIAAGKLSENFAFGGAETLDGFLPPSVALQTLNFGALDPADIGPRPLVSIWAGANDIRNSLLGGTPLDTPTVAVGAANNIKSIIEGFAGSPFNDFLVFNLPDLGQTAELLGEPGAPLGSASTSAFNSALAANIAMLESAGVNIIEVDIAALFVDVIADPASFGFSNVSLACIENPATCDPRSWLFFDGIHPTAAGHAAIEVYARAAITDALAVSAVPIPATASLLVLAVFGLGAIGRRRA